MKGQRGTKRRDVDKEQINLTATSDQTKDTPEKNNLVPPWKTCLVLSAAFLFVYTSFEAIQNLQSSLNHDSNLGVWSLSVLYSSVIVGSISGSTIGKLFGAKRLLQIGYLSHLCYICSNFYPTFMFLVPASALLGVGVGMQSVALGLYLTACSTSYIFYHNLNSERLHGVLSLFNGVFYSCFKGTHVTGNLISSLILFTSSYNSTVLEHNLCGAGLCTTSDNSTVIPKPEKEVVQTLMGAFGLSNLTGFIILSVGLPNLSVTSDTTEKPSVARNLSGCIRRVSSIKFLLLMPVIMAQAMVVIIMYTGFTEAFVTCTIGVEWVGYVMISLGASAAMSSLVVNTIARYLGRPALFLFSIGIDLGTLIVMLLWVPDSDTDKRLLFILPAVAGISEGILQPQLSALIASVFPDDLSSAFAAFHGCKCSAFAISLAMSGLACLYHRLYLAMILHILGIMGYIVTEVRERRKRDSLESSGAYERLIDKDSETSFEKKPLCEIFSDHNGSVDDGDYNSDISDHLKNGNRQTKCSTYRSKE